MPPADQGDQTNAPSHQIPFATLLDETHTLVRHLADTLADQSRSSASPRVQLLTTAFANQLREVTSVVERIRDAASGRVLQRNVLTSVDALKRKSLKGGADSREVTTWLVQSLNRGAQYYAVLQSTNRLGAASAIADELEQLFTAQAKRIAMEAHRFEDL